MDRLKELTEAKEAAEELFGRIENAISSLDSASSWGIWDLLGGGLITSSVKREKIREANADIREISSLLKALNKELEDVDMQLPDEVSDTTHDQVVDIWFDNIITDIRVQEEIKEELKDLKEFREALLGLITKINYDIETIR